MAKFVTPLMDAVVARLQSTLPTNLQSVATEESLTIENPVAYFDHRRAFTRQYPNVQVYPLSADFPEEENQNYRTGVYRVRVDGVWRSGGLGEEDLEKVGRAFDRAVDNTLFNHYFSGLVTIVLVSSHEYADSFLDKNDSLIGGGRVDMSYTMTEPLT